MTWSGHLAVAGLTLTFTDRPEIIIPLNLGLHYALDFIPHAEWHTFDTERHNRPAAVIVTLLDVLLTLALIGWFVNLFGTTLTVIAFGAAILPDLYRGLVERWQRYPIIYQLWWLDAFSHTWPAQPTHPISTTDWSQTATLKTPLWLKLTFQLLALALPIVLIRSYFLQ